MKRYFFFAFYSVIIFMTGTSLLFAKDTPDDLQLPLGTMTLKAPAHFQTEKSPVNFSHSAHFKFSCMACHHEWDQFSPVKGCTTSGCHEKLNPSPPSGKPSQNKKIISLTGAYHKACRGCHRTQLEEIKNLKKQGVPGQSETPLTTGPIACDGCHPATPVIVKHSLDSLSIPLGTMTLAPPEGREAERSSVEFPHGIHFDQACQTCHHKWDGNSPVQNCTTSGCHDQLEAAEKTRNINDPKNTRYFMAAYHKACIGCHRSLGKQEKMMVKTGKIKAGTPPMKNGPTHCNKCHQ